ncbi:conjugal transfer protein [Curtobacterium flaccumfaciens]|uniref:conjugal transfer protein n=1 Tax=Curtobacterium flaccumfaciens TaxID=2035 RepID=UPI001E31C5A8|nr:conjugal transfer protein [Curtobacterium allii]MCE0459521.1 conjugal transfer protein [Curtobacterium allii]
MAGQFAQLVSKVLGIQAYREHREQEAASTTKPEAAPKVGGASMWVRNPEPTDAPTTNRGGGGTVPWEAIPAHRGARRIWVYRAVLIVLIGLPWLVGVVRMVNPPAAAAPTATQSAAPFPDTAGAAVAQRFAVSYLSWDEDAPEDRAAALALDVPGINGQDKFGWNGKGHQSAGSATTVSIDAETSKVATVTVAARVTPYNADDKAGTARWAALAVPVEVREGRVIVTGQPAAVAVPAPTGSSRTQPNKDEDTALGRSTESYARSFFTAYGSDADVSAVAAPSARIAGLDGLYTLDDLSTWQVFKGTGDTREAFATVDWKAGAATVTQNYRITLTQVTSGDTARWQVASVDAATN